MSASARRRKGPNYATGDYDERYVPLACSGCGRRLADIYSQGVDGATVPSHPLVTKHIGQPEPVHEDLYIPRDGTPEPVHGLWRWNLTCKCGYRARLTSEDALDLWQRHASSQPAKGRYQYV